MSLLHKATQTTGQWGEAQAVRYLKRKGYQIIERNYSCRFGEIDIIAADSSFLLFVEVKTRKNDGFAEAKEFVGAAKQRRIQSAASLWFSEHESDLQPRFDVIEIYGTMDMPFRKLEIRHLEDAF